MIESIVLSNVATYDNQLHTIGGLSRLNFFSGANASGKTTISKVIADHQSHPTCTITWRNGTVLPSLVYNRDFVTRNFGPSTDIKGIFTLGEKQAESQAKIDTALAALTTVKQAIIGLTATLEGAGGTSGKLGELNELEAWLTKKCWVQKQKYDEKFQAAFEGLRSSQERFKNRVLAEYEKNKVVALGTC